MKTIPTLKHIKNSLSAFLLPLGMVLLLGVPRAEALVTDTLSSSGNWGVSGNWTSGVLPWENAAGDTSVDLGFASGASVMTVDSAPVWTGAQFGANAGNPFVVRRVNVAGGKTLRIETGGVLKFSGDSRIVANSTGSTLIMTGGELRSTLSNLEGVLLGGGHGGFTLSGTSVVDISDSRSGKDPGIYFGDSSAASGALHVIGSDVSFSVEHIGFKAGNPSTYYPKFRFTLDAGGASALSVTNQLDLTTAFNTISLQLYLETGLLDAPDTITLFDLANGSNGTFDEVVTSRGTFAATEGTIIEIASAGDPSQYLEYKLTYALNGTDIGLLAVPEPSSLGLIGVLLLAGLLRRRRLCRAGAAQPCR